MSGKENTVEKFGTAVVLLAKLIPEIRDHFFARTFHKKIVRFITVYVRVTSPAAGAPNVAQSSRSALLYAVDSIADLLEYFQYLKLISSTPLLVATHALLQFRISVAGERAGEEVVPKKETAPAPEKKLEKAPQLQLNPSQEKIFNFIKNSPNVRTKEIVEKFSTVSERTVKRWLKELVGHGLLKKHAENKAVRYSASDSN